MARRRIGEGTWRIAHVPPTHRLKSSQPVYTDAYLYDKDIFEEVEKFQEAIFREIPNKANGMPAEWELVLDLDDGDLHECICYYYFVNCSNRTLFWLHHFDVTPLLYGLPTTSKGQISGLASRPTGCLH